LVVTGLTLSFSRVDHNSADVIGLRTRFDQPSEKSAYRERPPVRHGDNCEDVGVPSAVPALEVGGTHVTAALVDPDTWTLSGPRVRADIDARADADTLLVGFAEPAANVEAPSAATWAVAMPDPFDYPHGIGRFRGVGKFEALDGVDVRAGLCQRLRGTPRDIVFCNDADAFTVGEWVSGAARGATRVVGLTLGTGVGSGWIDGGRVVDPGTPPGGRAHRLQVDGGGLEDVMSRRALRRAYRAASGDAAADVRDIAERARGGDEVATSVLSRAVRTLGRALAGPIREFGAELVVVGGSMARSWDLFAPWYIDGAGRSAPVVVVASHPDDAPLIGAAYVAAATPSR
jgi:glucokinase